MKIPTKSINSNQRMTTKMPLTKISNSLHILVDRRKLKLLRRKKRRARLRQTVGLPKKRRKLKRLRSSRFLMRTLAASRSISLARTGKCARGRHLSIIAIFQRALEDPAFARIARYMATIKSRKVKSSLTSKSLFR